MMTKLRAKPVVKKRNPTMVEKSGPRPVDPERVMLEIANLVRSSAVDMVQNTIDQARKGQYQAMRYLFEMAGLYPANTAPGSDRDGESLAGTLLAHLAALQREPTSETPDDNAADTVR